METTEQVATPSQPAATTITTSEGTTQELEEIAADPRIRQALHDKINSDIFIADQRAQAEAGTGEEPTLETETGLSPGETKIPWSWL